MLYVTHDQVEAMTLADRLVVLRAGKIEQIGAPLEVYARPVSRFVAGFLGTPTMNFVAATIEGGRAQAEGLDLPVPGELPAAVLVGIRPEDLRPVEPGARAEVRLVVEVVEAMGFETYAHGHIAGAPFVARLEGGASVARGDTLELAVRHAHYFDPRTELAIHPAETS
jgi:ABC-type sugar transport system ATPase subunit